MGRGETTSLQGRGSVYQEQVDGLIPRVYWGRTGQFTVREIGVTNQGLRPYIGFDPVSSGRYSNETPTTLLSR